MSPTSEATRAAIASRSAALDLHRIVGATLVWEGADQCGLAPVDPPVRFGFGSTPRRPSLARILTLVCG